MLQVMGIAGSIRAGSYNRALLAAAVELAPEGVTITPWDGLREVPHYDAGLDNDEERPPVVADLKRRVAECDALLLVTPEYNHSVPGVLKNALDWVSRPGGRSPLAGKPAGIMGVSTSAVGTARSQIHLREILYSTRSHTFPHGGVLVASAAGKFSDGRLADEATRTFLAAYLTQFAEFVGSLRKG
jgi:chromate reductase